MQRSIRELIFLIELNYRVPRFNRCKQFLRYWCNNSSSSNKSPHTAEREVSVHSQGSRCSVGCIFTIRVKGTEGLWGFSPTKAKNKNVVEFLLLLLFSSFSSILQSVLWGDRITATAVLDISQHATSFQMLHFLVQKGALLTKINLNKECTRLNCQENLIIQQGN